MTEELLFVGGDLDASLRHERERLIKAVQKESETYLLNADEAAWADHLVDVYIVQTPELQVDSMEIEDLGEASVDVSHQSRQRAIFDPTTPTYIAGRRIRLRLPFTGDANVFKLRAQTQTLSPPRAAVSDSEIQVVYAFPNDLKPNIKSEVDQLVAKLEQHLAWSRAQIERYNASLRDDALSAIRSRKQRALSDREFLDGLGIPVRRRDDAPTTFAAPGIERRVAPKPVAARAKPQPLAPTMVDDLYQHVLGLIRSMASAMERTPEIYTRHAEEHLRDQLLAMLNANYEGQATGETFNAAGKTDIVVRVEDRNVFIGECKWWSGQVDFGSAISQLFGYSTWRDTKLALVVFVRAKGLSEIVRKAKATLEERSEFIAWEVSTEETELRCKMRWPEDPERHAQLVVQFFHFTG